MLTNEAIEVHLSALHKGQDELQGGHTRLSEKISRLSDDVADMRGMQRAMVWVVGGLGSLGFVGKIFRWF